MAATTVVDTIFGAAGVSDVQMFHPGLVAIKRKIDFSKTNTAASTNYAVLSLPKSFVALGTAIESGADGNGAYPAATAFTLKVADASDSANDKTLGAAFTPSNAAYKREANLGTSQIFDDGAIVNAAFGAQTAGVVEVAVVGFVPFADGLGNLVTPDPRGASAATATTQDNVAKLDPYYG